MEYSSQKKVRFDGFRLAKGHQRTGEKISAMAYSDDKAGKFFWEVLSRSLIYSANRIPEICDDVVNVDNALKWGFGWELGPFEAWDAIGLDRSVDRMNAEEKKVPKWIQGMLASGKNHFYEISKGSRYFYDMVSKDFKTEKQDKKSLNLNLKKSSGNLITKHWSASIIDVGDGIINVEFHSILQPVLNPIDGSILQIINE